MHTVFLVTAALGCTLLVIQVLLQLFGGHHDSHAGAELHLADNPDQGVGDPSVFAGLLSMKSLTAFCAFFGLGGLAAEEGGIASGGLRATIATLAGVCAMGIVFVMMRQLAKLQVSGTLNVDHAVGRPATVYLRIPGNMNGTGKITVSVDGREVEMLAMTQGPEIPTGAQVEVTRRVNANTFEVART
jgi:hypothetical protein